MSLTTAQESGGAAALLYLQRTAWTRRNYAASEFLRRHLVAQFPVERGRDVIAEMQAELEEDARKKYRGTSTAAGVRTTDRGVAAEDERIYRQHNITHRHKRGTVAAAPNAPSMQCQCDHCKAHRRRSPITGTADVGKDI